MTNPSGIQAVVFDLDGLMFNTEILYDEVGDMLLQRRGHRFTPELKRRMMGRPGRVSLQIMIDDHQLDATVEQLQSESDEIFAEILPQRLEPMPGLSSLLDALEAAGMPKAIATSSGRAYTETVLNIFGWRGRFAFILTAEDVVHGKPDPEVYLTAARRFDLPAEQLLVLEDSENGCRAASAAGAFTVAVPCEDNRHHDFDGVSLIADSLTSRCIYDALGLP
jgi:HAD superfamily hydrolase (TIGR01509 family)